MKKVLYGFVALFIALAACKNGDKKQVVDNNPLFQDPKLKDISDKIAQDPENAALYFERGNKLHKLEEDSLAIVDFKKAISLDSTKATYYSAIGEVLFEHKDISGSVTYIEKALKLNPEDKVAQLKLAKMFVYIKEYSKAFCCHQYCAEARRICRRGLFSERDDIQRPEGYFKGNIQFPHGCTGRCAICGCICATGAAIQCKGRPVGAFLLQQRLQE